MISKHSARGAARILPLNLCPTLWGTGKWVACGYHNRMVNPDKVVFVINLIDNSCMYQIVWTPQEGWYLTLPIYNIVDWSEIDIPIRGELQRTLNVFTHEYLSLTMRAYEDRLDNQSNLEGGCHV